MDKKPIVQLFLENTFQSIFSFLKVILLSKFKVKIGKACNADKSCVILGNGPSLISMINQNNSFLRDKVLVCVNHFPSTEYYEILKPTIFVTGAPDLWKEDIEERFIRNSKILFKNISAKTNWPLKLFIPFGARKFNRWQNEVSKNKNIKIIFFNNTPIEGWKSISHLFFRSNLGMPRPHNVMIPSILLALNLGYKKIYLWGADHSWLSEIKVAENNKTYINQKHFYDEKSSKPEILDKRGKGGRKLHEVLYKFMTAFKGYFALKDYAKSLNSEIYNQTEGSFIDAFERKKLIK